MYTSAHNRWLSSSSSSSSSSQSSETGTTVLGTGGRGAAIYFYISTSPANQKNHRQPGLVGLPVGSSTHIYPRGRSIVEARSRKEHAGVATAAKVNATKIKSGWKETRIEARA
jgi:hypothetical protein